ncbi:hypothetical protein [Elizabethkingia anophelis]|uniref:hypothetical protein n=1 Tax=Elizabethkingia anophelis TaxID=1117645 RepID=UPI003892C72D
METKKTNYHSNEMLQHFYGWLNDWDKNINTFDDEDVRKSLKNKLNYGMSVITSIQNKSDEKVLKNASNDSEAGKALLENQSKKWYKDFSRMYHDMQSIIFSIDQLYELKNRKSLENIRLRAELAKLKQQLK